MEIANRGEMPDIGIDASGNVHVTWLCIGVRLGCALGSAVHWGQATRYKLVDKSEVL